MTDTEPALGTVPLLLIAAGAVAVLLFRFPSASGAATPGPSALQRCLVGLVIAGAAYALSTALL